MKGYKKLHYLKKYSRVTKDLIGHQIVSCICLTSVSNLFGLQNNAVFSFEANIDTEIERINHL